MICSICKEDKHENEFNPRERRCKKCHNAYSAEHRSKNIDRYRAYEKKRQSLPHRMEHNRKKNNKLNKTIRWKRNCNCLLNKALKNGEVIKKKECEIFNCTDKPIGHHFDYTRPLDVLWLCEPHHAQYHFGVSNQAMKIKEEINRLVENYSGAR